MIDKACEENDITHSLGTSNQPRKTTINLFHNAIKTF